MRDSVTSITTMEVSRTLHQSLNPFAIRPIALLAQHHGHLPSPVEGRFQVLLVNQLQQSQLLLWWGLRTMVKAGTGNAQQLALVHHT